MKFGDTLIQRSVPKWAAYNVNYNEIKRLIKLRTTKGIAAPVAIPGQGSSQWAQLEDELFVVLQQQHDNAALFLKSKHGEIERRLSHVEKQIRGAHRSVDLSKAQPILLARRYHRFLQEADSIGEDIQALSRFSAVQRTAFRKLLKKYRKWTGSLTLQSRLEQDVFSSRQLSLDLQTPLERLTALTEYAKRELQEPMLRGRSALERRKSAGVPTTSGASRIHEAAQRGTAAFDTAFATAPFGHSAGLATYWIHPDNVDEARTLMLSHVQEICKPPLPSIHNSTTSLSPPASLSGSHAMSRADTFALYCDNVQRYVQDQEHASPSKAALSARWGQDGEAAVTTSNLSPWQPVREVTYLKHKDLQAALTRDDHRDDTERQAGTSAAAQRIQDYLLEHRDVKPLARATSRRSRYASPASSAKLGTWATLDTHIFVSPCVLEQLNLSGTDMESSETFPHAVLQVRWEFGHTPELVRTFDNSHLAEKVGGFSVEAAAIYMVHSSLPQPPWQLLLQNDIRKLPITKRTPTHHRRASPTKSRAPISTTASSGTSSLGGTADSTFSAGLNQSSATSDDSLMTPDRDLSAAETLVQSTSRSTVARAGHKKARIRAQSPATRPMRYWNEFDDGDSDVGPEEGYAIYVDPDEALPGFETIRAIFDSVGQSLGAVKSRFTFWSSGRHEKKARQVVNEQSPLLPDRDTEQDTSDSDTTPTSPTTPQWQVRQPSVGYAANRHLVSGPTRSVTRLARDQVHLQFSAGLLIIAYVLLFVSTVLHGTGRKKQKVEVDAGVIAGTVAAELCAILSIALVQARRVFLKIWQWAILYISIAGAMFFGIVLLVSLISVTVW